MSLTIEGHACQHDILWRVWGVKGDYIASRCLWGADASDVVNSRFEHCTHSPEAKRKIGQSLQEYYLREPRALEKRKEQMRQLGKGGHKRNPEPGCRASAEKGRGYMRQHWKKELWDAIYEAWHNRSGFHWGKTALAKTFDVPVKTVENMHKHIVSGKSWSDVVGENS